MGRKNRRIGEQVARDLRDKKRRVERLRRLVENEEHDREEK